MAPLNFTRLGTVILMAMALVAVTAACSQSTPTPAATASSTPAPEATATPSPMATPTPSPTIPSPTVAPAAPPQEYSSPTPRPAPTRTPLPEGFPTATPLPEGSPTGTPLPEGSPTATPTATPSRQETPPPGPIQGLRISVSLSDTSAAVGSSLVLRARVTDLAGRPVPGVIVAFIVGFPGRDWADFAPNTDERGQTEQSFPVTDIGELPPGTVVIVNVWAIYFELDAAAMTSFTIR